MAQSGSGVFGRDFEVTKRALMTDIGQDGQSSVRAPRRGGSTPPVSREALDGKAGCRHRSASPQAPISRATAQAAATYLSQAVRGHQSLRIDVSPKSVLRGSAAAAGAVTTEEDDYESRRLWATVRDNIKRVRSQQRQDEHIANSESRSLGRTETPAEAPSRGQWASKKNPIASPVRPPEEVSRVAENADAAWRKRTTLMEGTAARPETKSAREESLACLREAIRVLKEERQAHDTQLLDAIVWAKSVANIPWDDSKHDARRFQDVVGQCCFTMQALAATAGSLANKKDELEEELHALRLSHRGELFTVEAEQQLLRENARKQCKEIDALKSENHMLKQRLAQAQEAQAGWKQEAQDLSNDNLELAASRFGIEQVARELHLQLCDGHVAYHEMQTQLANQEQATRELYSAFVQPILSESFSQPMRLQRHSPAPAGSGGVSDQRAKPREQSSTSGLACVSLLAPQLGYKTQNPETHHSPQTQHGLLKGPADVASPETTTGCHRLTSSDSSPIPILLSGRPSQYCSVAAQQLGRTPSYSGSIARAEHTSVSSNLAFASQHHVRATGPTSDLATRVARAQSLLREIGRQERASSNFVAHSR